MEGDKTPGFLRGVPRAWLDDGKVIQLDQVATYFGPASLKVESRLSDATIRVAVACRSNRQPRCVEVRIPHPLGKHPIKVIGGTYDIETECVRVEPFHD